jgi:hypothetical protein
VGTGGTTSISVGTTSGTGGFGGYGEGGAGVGGFGGYGADDGGFGGYGADDGGYGGYDSTSGCSDLNGYWAAIDVQCVGPIDCENANSGDPCALPGDSCEIDDYCEYTTKYCEDDLTWSVETSYGSSSCDGPVCDPLVCPSEVPIAGDYCDPCYDYNPQCVYEIETECGFEPVIAVCNSAYTWEVPESDCLDGL